MFLAVIALFFVAISVVQFAYRTAPVAIVPPSPWVVEKGQPVTLEVDKQFYVATPIWASDAPGKRGPLGALAPETVKLISTPEWESIEYRQAINDIEIYTAKKYFNSPRGRCPFSGRWK